jgi:hypothetical protein
MILGKYLYTWFKQDSFAPKSYYSSNPTIAIQSKPNYYHSRGQWKDVVLTYEDYPSSLAKYP